MEVREATLVAASTRFRPIVMTGVSTAIGALPLVLAIGPGSESRITIGVVIFSGVLVATLFTLFVVPTAYAVMGRFTKTPNWMVNLLNKQAVERGEKPTDRGNEETPTPTELT
jgi:multidrug efflux pump